MNFTTLPADLQNFVTQFEVHPIMVIIVICVIYVVLGTAMEELSMILLTVPIFFPLRAASASTRSGSASSSSAWSRSA